MLSIENKPSGFLRETHSDARRSRRPILARRSKRMAASKQRPPARSRAAQAYVERDELAVKLLPLVRRVALELRERLPQYVELEDLSSSGVLGLLDAVSKFDARKHVKVETYARHRIRGAILDSLRELDTASRDMRRKNKVAEKTFHAMQAKFGRTVTDEELARALGMTLKQWYRTQHQLSNMGIDWMRPNHFPENSLVDEENVAAKVDPENPFDLCYRREQREVMARAAAMLPERERLVLSLYYEHELSMKQVGERLGIDESRVSQIHSAAIAHLRGKVKRILQPVQPGLAPLPVVAGAQGMLPVVRS